MASRGDSAGGGSTALLRAARGSRIMVLALRVTTTTPAELKAGYLLMWTRSKAKVSRCCSFATTASCTPPGSTARNSKSRAARGWVLSTALR